MKPVSPVFATLAARYRRRRAGRTGQASNAVVEDFETLLREAGCADGDARAVAETELKAAEAAGVLERVPHHRRDRENIAGIRLLPERESEFFRYIGATSPAEERAALADQFAAASASRTASPRSRPSICRAFSR